MRQLNYGGRPVATYPRPPQATAHLRRRPPVRRFRSRAAAARFNANRRCSVCTMAMEDHALDQVIAALARSYGGPGEIENRPQGEVGVEWARRGSHQLASVRVPAVRLANGRLASHSLAAAL